MSFLVTREEFYFYLGTVCHFMGVSTYVALQLKDCGIRLLVEFSFIFVVSLFHLVDKPSVETINSFQGKRHRVHGLNRNLDSTGKFQLCYLDLEDNLQDSFIVDRT